MKTTSEILEEMSKNPNLIDYLSPESDYAKSEVPDFICGNDKKDIVDLIKSLFD